MFRTVQLWPLVWVTWIQSICGLYHESHESFMCHIVPVHLWSLSWVTCIRHESDGSIPPVVFIISHMDPVHPSSLSGVTWIFLESHGSSPPVLFIRSHIYLSWVTWIQSTSGPYHLLALVMNLWVLWTVHWLSAVQGLRFMEFYFVVRPILLLI